ncbi:hypothetical protein Ndes2437B_g08800 [Nannochloris sp. 'desiccata']
MTPSIGGKKASAVEELKALILACDAGTGEVARHIEEAQFTPRHNAFTSLLQLASKSRQPEKAVEIFEAMQSITGITPNTFSYSALISALARVGDWQQAERYFNELLEHSKTNSELRPNTVTYAAMISAYEKGRQLDKALAIFEAQIKARVDPDMITYSSLLSACERAGAVDQAVEVLDTMHAQGLTGPRQMYNSVIAACGIRWKPALETFLGMQCAGVEATEQTATLLMASLCAAKQRDHALALLQQVAQAHWKLSLTAYTSLLKLLASLGDWRAADVCHAHMVYSGIRPDALAAASIVNAHAIGGDSIGAEQLAQHFINTCILPRNPAATVNGYHFNQERKQRSQGSTPKSGKASSIDAPAAVIMKEVAVVVAPSSDGSAAYSLSTNDLLQSLLLGLRSNRQKIQARNGRINPLKQMACSRPLLTLPIKLTLVIILSILPQCIFCQITEVEALLAFRSSISNWDAFSVGNNINGWNASTPVCLWTGVSCNAEGRVVTVTLACNGCSTKASGNLPPALSTLVHLTSLDLQYNEFSGSLPEIWAGSGQFPALQSLYLGNNSLSGQVPWQGTAFPKLQLLRLDGNRFSGPWPDELTLPALSVLRAYNNQFSGSLSTRLLNNMPRMQILSFQYNQLTGELPREWVNSTDAVVMQELYLQGNQFTGSLPPEWGIPPAFPNLGILDLHENPGLGGELPSVWGTVGSFPKLASLRLNACSFEGELPQSWATAGAFASIDVIDVSNNNLTGSVNNWQGMSTLSRLVVHPGNPGLCISENEPPFALCSTTDPSCLLVNPSLPSCDRSAAATDGGGGGDSFPTVAVAVGLGVGIPLVMLLGCLFFILLRKSRRSREIEAAQKRRVEQTPHPFDTWEGQAALTSPFSGAVAFSSINAAAVAPVVRTSEETIITTPTPHNSSCGSSSHDSIGSRCARVRTRSFEYPRSGPPTPPVSGSAPTSTAARIGVALPQPETPTPSTQPRINFNPYFPSSSSLELQPVRTSKHSKSGSMEGAAAVRGSGSGFSGGSFPRSSLDALSPSGTGSPTSGNYFGGLDMPFSDWEVHPNELEVIKRPDGSGADWELGRGAWGRVYKALRGGVQPVAVKELQIGSSGGMQQMSVDAFKQEIAILRGCRDANIVQFQGAYLGPDQTLLVTEYMEGGDLMANIAAGRVTWWRRGRKIAIDVAKGLCFLHNRRIVHFDLKSPNILLGRDGTAKIGDVGMARILVREYVTGVMGTLSWSAPEMLWGTKCTEKADIYSYGIVLWEICTGEKPVRGQLRDVKVPEECPEQVRILMLQCLDTRPSRRPSALQIVERLKQSPADPPPGVPLRRLSATGEPTSVRYSGGVRSSDERERGGPAPIAECRESNSSARASGGGGDGDGDGGRPSR